MKAIFLFVVLLSFYKVDGQTLTRKELSEKLNFSNQTIFVINGELYNSDDSLKLDNILFKISSDRIIQLPNL